jgi:aspartyl-tRNA(Asn)/glutamyl-tRNA(Gln) amidotransferase subunit A
VLRHPAEFHDTFRDSRLTSIDVLDYVDRPDRRDRHSIQSVVRALAERIEVVEPRINSFVTLRISDSLEEARLLDSRRREGSGTAPLAGFVVAVKDNIDVRGVRTTVGSRFFARHHARRDAEVIRRLRRAGAIVIGKAALHEFMYGATTNNPHYGVCRNPWNLERIPGGSSGGSGAALAADLCVGALGTDTGGSVRIPASLNGVSGLRPTFGSVSNRRVFPMSSSFDTVGPMARAVSDIAAMLRVLAGRDPRDPWSSQPPSQGGATLSGGVEGLRIGVPTNHFFDQVDPGIVRTVWRAADEFDRLGAQVAEMAVPGVETAIEQIAVMTRAEAFALHEGRLRTRPHWFGEDIRRRLSAGAAVTGSQFARALRGMYQWQASMRRRFQTVDLILTPTLDSTAPPIATADTSMVTARMTRFTYPWSFAHVPAMSIPCGFDELGLPIGLQLAAAPWQENLLLRAGMAFQAISNWHRRRPSWLVELTHEDPGVRGNMSAGVIRG